MNHEHRDGVMTVQQQADLAQQALQAFERDLPQLWAERPEQWVAYQGDRLLGFAAHPTGSVPPISRNAEIRPTCPLLGVGRRLIFYRSITLPSTILA